MEAYCFQHGQIAVWMVISNSLSDEISTSHCEMLASFPVSTPQLFFAHSKISGDVRKKGWGVETGNEAT